VPGRIIYLEVDDEITSAAARIRSAEATRLAVVLPNGSRVATSRINFRLLSRDALTHEKRLSIVSGDPATRALAASAGLPVFATVAEYEGSLAGLDDEPGTGTAAAVAAGAGAGTGVVVTGAAAADDAAPPAPAATADDAPASDGTLGLVAPAVAAAGAAHTTTLGGTAGRSAVTDDSGAPGETIRTTVRPSTAGPGASTIRPRPGATTVAQPGWRGRGGTRTPWLIGSAILALALLIGAVGVYLLLPSATIAVTPRPEPVGPIQITVMADTKATSPDPTGAVVPATLVTIPVAVDNTFPATGKRVQLTKATGTVRFENLDPTSSNRIVAGSIVSTDTNVRFRTAVTINVPRAELVGLTIFPARASVKVTAVDGGPDGNVDPNTIDHVPRGENGLFLKVTNPEATTGGKRDEFTRVTQEDVDAAMGALNGSLQEAFREAMADPALSAGGATVFPATGQLGEPVPTVPPETLVGQEVATFALGLSANGTFVTVDSAPVSAIAETRIGAELKTDHRLVAGSTQIEVNDAIITGQTVSFPVIVSAQQVAILDPAALKAMVLGMPVAEAKAILAPFGDVELTVSPDWAGSVPSFDSRVELTVSQAVEIETPGPSASPSP
jgi:hypothetical protein